jgi:hypothetical protein
MSSAISVTPTYCPAKTLLTDIIFDKVAITNSIGEALVLNSASVKWNGTVRSGTIGGPAERFY